MPSELMLNSKGNTTYVHSPVKAKPNRLVIKISREYGLQNDFKENLTENTENIQNRVLQDTIKVQCVTSDIDLTSDKQASAISNVSEQNGKKNYKKQHRELSTKNEFTGKKRKNESDVSFLSFFVNLIK